MDSIIVGDQHCKFEDVANLIVGSPVADVVETKLGEVFRRLGVGQSNLRKIKRSLSNEIETFYESIIRCMEAWRAKQGSAATLSKFVFVLQECDLNDVADTLKHQYCHISPTQRFTCIPEAVKLALRSLDKLVVIKTTSPKLLLEWIQETDEENIVLKSDFMNILKQQTSAGKLFFVTKARSISVTEMLKKLKDVDNKVMLVVKQIDENIDSIDAPPPTHVIQQKLIWESLTKDFQNFLMNKEFLIGQRKTTLSQNLTNISQINLNDALSDTFLTNLICSTAQASQLFSLNVLPLLNGYIKRRLIPRNKININVFNDESEDKFAFKGLTISELSFRVPHETFDTSSNQVQKDQLDVKFIILDHYSHFEIISAKAKAAVHYCIYKDGELTWVASKGAMSVIQKHIVPCNTRYSEGNFIDHIETQHKEKACLPMNSVIISDSPGMGKSALLAKLAITLHEKFPERIILFVRLGDVVKGNQFLVQSDNLFDVFLKLACAENKLLETILQNVLTEHEENESFSVEIFLDGFDEISIENRNFAETLLKTLKSKFLQGRNCIWVTTRPHSLDILQHLLNTLEYNIEPFLHTEQVDMLKSVWSYAAVSAGKTLNKTYLDYFSERCLSTITNKLDKQARNIAGIPLQCQLIAEAYSKNANQYCDQKNVVGKQVTPIFNLYRLTDLYKKFIEVKMEKYRKGFCIDESAWQLKKSKLIEMHNLISIELIFPGCFSRVPTALNYSDFTDLCNVGIVESNGGDLVPRFIHRTFAEYFAATYIVKKLYDKRNHAKLISTLFNTTCDVEFSTKDPLNIFVKKTSYEQGVVCFFIENLLAENARGKNRIPNCNMDTIDVYPIISTALSEDYMFLFKWFTENYNWAKYMSSNGKHSLDKTNESSRRINNLLFLAVRYSRSELLHQVLEKFKILYPNVRLPIYYDVTLLHIAVKYREFKVVNKLINEWYKGFQGLRDGLVHWCISDTVDLNEGVITQKLEILNLICVRYANIINHIWIGYSPLHLPNVHFKLKLKLLELGADVNIVRVNCGGTVLHTRMPSDYHLRNFLNEILSNVLRKRDCRQIVLVKDNLGFTSLHRHVLSFIPWGKTLKVFRDLGADFNSVNNVGDSIIASAIMTHQQAYGIRSLLDAGAGVNWRGKGGKSLLHIAIFKGNIGVFKLLFDRGLDVNIKDDQGNTVLHDLIKMCSQTPKEKIVTLLLQNGARLDIKNTHGHTPLQCCLSNRTVCEPLMPLSLLKVMHGSQTGDVLTLSLILQTLVLSTTDKVAKESLKLANNLVESGADLNFTTENGNSLLFLAMELACLPIIKWLIENGLQVSSQNLFGDTPLHHLLSVNKGNHKEEFEVMSYLLDAGDLIMIQTRNFENETVMDLALKNYKRVFVFLMNLKFKKDGLQFSKDLVSKTIHNIAVTTSFSTGDGEFIKELVSLGADVNYQDAKGNTVLHYAAQTRSIEWVRFFINIGCNKKLKNVEMRLPVHMLYNSNIYEYQPKKDLVELVQKLLPQQENSLNVTNWIKLHESVRFGDTTTFNLILADKAFSKYILCNDFVWYVMGIQSLGIISSFCDFYKSSGFNLITLGTGRATSALHVAAIRSEIETVEYLLRDNLFKVSLSSLRMSNIIHKLVQHSKVDHGRQLENKYLILKLLVEHNSTLVNTICEGIPSSLVDNIHADLLLRLVENGANVTAANADGDNLTHLAVKYLDAYEYSVFMRFLLNTGKLFLFQAKGKDKCTALHRVVTKWGRIEDVLPILIIFKLCGADFNAMDKNGQSVLVYAVKARCNPDNNVILELVKNGSLWNTLFTSVCKGDTKLLLKHLLFKGIDISSEDSNGVSIYSIIQNTFDKKTVSVLLNNAKANGDGNVKTKPNQKRKWPTHPLCSVGKRRPKI